MLGSGKPISKAWGCPGLVLNMRVSVKTPFKKPFPGPMPHGPCLCILVVTASRWCPGQSSLKIQVLGAQAWPKKYGQPFPHDPLLQGVLPDPLPRRVIFHNALAFSLPPLPQSTELLYTPSNPLLRAQAGSPPT